MAAKKDIREGAYFRTPEGFIGQAYAVSKRKKDEGIVDLFFEGAGSVFPSKLPPPSGMFKVEFLTVIKNKYFKGIVDGEVYNRVEDPKGFEKQFKGLADKITVEKLSDEEFEETEK